ncbi:hypothetical protein [Larkinella arboricola]|uniref:Uncharacterized protein n=1 Tax=Larkinella arboricola TaxID=643671 RepID=A0A327X7L3_LARAB|nr:hypothetical protein [Larkinella arboricola]RAK02987.1 hypothetical protein LX87_01109 [Larkinella arboricola]
MTQDPKEPYRGDAGDFIRNRDAEMLTRNFRQFKEERQGSGKDTYTRAEFFGINRINELLGHDDCVGIRIYYGLGRGKDDNGDPKPQLVLTAVNSKGKDIFLGSLTRDSEFRGKETDDIDDPTGLKDMPAGRDALANGVPCPQHC